MMLFLSWPSESLRGCVSCLGQADSSALRPLQFCLKLCLSRLEASIPEHEDQQLKARGISMRQHS